MKEEPFYADTPIGRPAPLFLRRVSWGAIFAGLVVALVLQIVLTILGVAVGASTFDPLNQTQSAKAYGIGTVIWMGVSSILSIFSGACVAGRLSGGPRTTDGILHGVATWATATLLSVLLLTTAVSNILGGTAKMLGQTMSTGLKSASSNAGSEGGSATLDTIKQEAMNLVSKRENALSPTGRSNEDDSKTNLMAQAKQNPELMAVLTRMFSRGGASADPQDKEKAINLLTAQGNMSREEAASAIDRWDQQYQEKKNEVKQQVRETGAAAASGVSKAAWWSFAFLVLSALAAAYGGSVGTRGLSYIRPHTPPAAA